MPANLVLVSAVVLSVVMLYLYLWDRAALETTRALGIDPSRRGALVPFAGKLSLLVTILWIVSLGFVWASAGFVYGLLVFLATSIAAIVTPIPRNHFQATFTRRLA